MKIFLIGFMGSGKTHYGRQLGEKLGLPFFDLDEQISSHVGKESVDYFQQDGEEGCRLTEKDLLHIITESHDSFVMACGGGSPCYFNNIDYMNNEGTTVWINTPADVLFDRLLKERERRPLIRDLSDDKLRRFIHKKFADRRIYYEQAEVKVEDEPMELDQLIEKIFRA